MSGDSYDQYYDPPGDEPDEADELREVLTELLRLYDWRKELAKEEAKLPIILSNDPASRQRQRDLRKNLREYGEQKKAAWERTRELLTRGK